MKEKEVIVKLRYSMKVGYEQEIVRCKDCKHGYKYEFCVKCENKGNPGMFGTYHSFNWFCYDGERKGS